MLLPYNNLDKVDIEIICSFKGQSKRRWEDARKELLKVTKSSDDSDSDYYFSVADYGAFYSDILKRECRVFGRVKKVNVDY